MSPMSPHVTMSHHTCARPGNHGFTCHQCHPMSLCHCATHVTRPRKPRFYHVTNVTPCHYVTPCKGVPPPHHVTSQQRPIGHTMDPRPGNHGFIMSPMSPHVTMSHHAPVPDFSFRMDYINLPERIHSNQSSSFENQIIKQLCLLYQVKKSKTDTKVLPCHQCHPSRTLSVCRKKCHTILTSSHPDIDTTPRPGNQGFIMSPMSPHVTMSHHAPVSSELEIGSRVLLRNRVTSGHDIKSPSQEPYIIHI